MNEDDREGLISDLVDDFRSSIGSAFNDEQKFAFMAGARAALVTIEERLAASIKAETEKLVIVNNAPASSVNDNLKVLHAARLSALKDFAER